MTKYAVQVEVTTTYLVTVEAPSVDAAEEQALNMEYNDMKEVEETVTAFALEDYDPLESELRLK